MLALLLGSILKTSILMKCSWWLSFIPRSSNTDTLGWPVEWDDQSLFFHNLIWWCCQSRQLCRHTIHDSCTNMVFMLFTIVTVNRIRGNRAFISIHRQRIRTKKTVTWWCLFGVSDVEKGHCIATISIPRNYAQTWELPCGWRTLASLGLF